MRHLERAGTHTYTNKHAITHTHTPEENIWKIRTVHSLRSLREVWILPIKNREEGQCQQEKRYFHLNFEQRRLRYTQKVVPLQTIKVYVWYSRINIPLCPLHLQLRGPQKLSELSGESRNPVRGAGGKRFFGQTGHRYVTVRMLALPPISSSLSFQKAFRSLLWVLFKWWYFRF